MLKWCAKVLKQIRKQPTYNKYFDDRPNPLIKPKPPAKKPTKKKPRR